MAFSCTMYCNTGFNSINIPDSVDLLASSASKVISGTSYDLKIVQDRFLSSIKVKTTWAEIQNCDYVRVDDFFYSVNGIQMLSDQVAQLQLVPDFLLSAGGTKNPKFSILDGVTERQTVSDDSWGKYTDIDPLTSPQQPLLVDTMWAEVSSASDSIFLETTIDLAQQYASKDGTTYTDPDSGDTVTVPATHYSNRKTSFSFAGSSKSVSNGTRVYKVNDGGSYEGAGSAETVVNGGLAQVRALGIENGSVINQWRVPDVFCDSPVSYGVITKVEEGGTQTHFTDPYIGTITGKGGTVQTTISASYGSPKNRRTLYGEYNKYGIITASGDSCEFNPEEIMSAIGSPEVSYRADPRPHGKPYYRFTTVNGNSEFWRNCIAGEEWENVPLVYQGSSGSTLNRLNYENSRKVADENYKYSMRQTGLGLRQTEFNKEQNMLNAGINAVTSGVQAMGSAASGDLFGTIYGAGNVIQSGINMYTIENNANMDLERQMNNGVHTVRSYDIAKANELSQLYQQTQVYVPNVVFPFNASIIRDVKGNGFLLYKYRYRDSDLNRVDKLLTMYGYKEQESVSTSNFKRRTKFDYVQCSTITVTGKPKWWNDGISAQLSSGVRVWHVKPTPSAYSDNPIAS